MATYSFGSSEYDSTGSRQWERQEWRWNDSYGAGLVRIRPSHRRHDWIAGYDIKYQSLRPIDR